MKGRPRRIDHMIPTMFERDGRRWQSETGGVCRLRQVMGAGGKVA